jgi:excisionase family DNA binding protein
LSSPWVDFVQLSRYHTRGVKNDDLLTREELLAYLKISRGTLYKLMKQNAFPYIKLERKVLFRKSDIDTWLESKLVK